MTTTDAPGPGAIVRRLRRSRGLTQAQLADRAGIDRSWLNQIETGKRTLGPSPRGKLAAALDVSVLELGAPEAEADANGRTLLDRQEELEEAVLKLTKQVSRLARQVADIKRQAPPATRANSRSAR